MEDEGFALVRVVRESCLIAVSLCTDLLFPKCMLFDRTNFVLKTFAYTNDDE